MMRALWVSKTGLEGQQTRLDVVANNLANVGTNGFKKQRAVFEDLASQQIIRPGGVTNEQSNIPSGVQLGAGVRVAANPHLFTQGSFTETRSNLDLAINGNGFFQIQLPDGSTGYTRDGNFQRSAEGLMVTSTGLTLLPGINIPEEAEDISIGKDGTVMVKLPGATDMTEAGRITIANFINPTGLSGIGSNLFVATPASGAPQEGNPSEEGLGSILQGQVENSNVNVAEEMVTMIETQRAYELNSKAITTADQMLARLSQMV